MYTDIHIISFEALLIQQDPSLSEHNFNLIQMHTIL